MTKLKKYMEEHNIRQDWLADQVGYSEAGISRIINGKRSGGIVFWMALAKVLKIDLEEIYGEDRDDR